MLLVILATVNLLSHYQYYVEEVCELYPLEREFVEAVIETESSWIADAESYCGAQGLMQIMPEWHQDRMDRLGVTDLKDAYSNILVGCDYLSELIDLCGNPTEALMIYNMGWNGSDLYEQGIVSAYAQKILNRTEELKKERSTDGTDGNDNPKTEGTDRVRLRTDKEAPRITVIDVSEFNLYRGNQEGRKKYYCKPAKREELLSVKS